MTQANHNKSPRLSRPLRKIRSFVKRQGRSSQRQTNAHEKLFPEFGIPYTEQRIDLTELFNRQAPAVLEIGFGMGDTLVKMAAENPETNYIGIEVHRPGIGSILASIDEKKIKNIRIFFHDAVEVLQHVLPEQSIDRVQIFFPDPWPKKRHHKRRLIQPEFVALLAKKLKPDGILHIATDWKDYAVWIEKIIFHDPDFIRHATQDVNDRPVTKFEKRGLQLGHEVWDMFYYRKS